VKNEKPDFLAHSPKYTLRFALQIGSLCRAMTIRDAARSMHLNWRTVKELDKMYMREQLNRAGAPKPKIIGIDEVSIRKRHTYRIVVSDLEVMDNHISPTEWQNSPWKLSLLALRGNRSRSRRSLSSCPHRT
jgi:transposase